MMTKWLKVTFAILVFSVGVFSQAIPYDNLLSWVSGFCPSQDKCKEMGNKNFSERNCECDELCFAYRDCCSDAPRQRINKSISNFCMPYGQDSSLGAYVVGRCPGDYAGPKRVKKFCEGRGDFEDPFFSTPVTDVLANVTFRNRYCVECNRAVTPSLKTWFISVKFENIPMNYRNEELVWKYLKFNPNEKKWGICTKRNFYPCFFTFHKPDDIASVRQCRLNVISSCPKTYDKVGLKTACRLYTSIVYSGETAYRNIQCAVCNGENPKRLFCTKRRRKDQGSDLRLSFQMMVDFNSKENTTRKCDPGTILDNFSKKCRCLICA
ncbi:SMB domain-containing protein [Nephila pilipes]|uniref:SMB domain-containing protein n=1 Tax=Nephila pilipes TaxID=299642 RepID=A0A8X6R4P6_NEPPI|nr:SMB domain-containing protein [Nephila pilipes]